MQAASRTRTPSAPPLAAPRSKPAQRAWVTKLARKLEQRRKSGAAQLQRLERRLANDDAAPSSSAAPMVVQEKLFHEMLRAQRVASTRDVTRLDVGRCSARIGQLDCTLCSTNVANLGALEWGASG